MANLSQNDRNIIAEHPLDTSLDHLREPLRKTEQSYKPGSLSFDGAADGPDLGPQKAISRLLSTLLGHEVAFNLRSKVGNNDIASELFELFKRVRSGRYNYEHDRALSRLVVKRASDVDIWNAVFDLIITVSRTTPPTSIPPSFDGTPITSSSASQQGGEQTQKMVDGRIFEEIKGCTCQNVEGFFSKYFEGKPWTERTKRIYQAVQERHADGRWTDFSQTPVQNEVVHDWEDVEVIGELTVSDHNKKAKLLQIGRYVRDVFSVQPTRRYVHAFTLCGNDMQAWVFDRSGPYSSTAFDIHEEPERFIRTIAGYVMMSDEELGLDNLIERHDGDRFITVVEDATGKERRLQLDPAPIAYQRAILCRGTSCFRAKTPSSKNSQYVAKFSWVSDKRRPEADLLRLARERGVEGVAKLFGHHRITSIAEMGEGLTFGKPYAFRNTTLSPASSFSRSQSLLPQPFGQIRSLGTARDLPKKRKSVDAGGSPSKRSRSNSQLHRDISENNIIITDPKEANGFTGMFIDTEYGKENGSGRSGARQQTGTMEFMAIQVLQRVAHTSRHDLESIRPTGKVT